MKLAVKWIAGLSLLAALAWPAAAQAPELAMLDTLQRGEWTLRSRQGEAPAKLCIRTGREFIQLRHSERGCSRFVVEDEPGEVTVHYTCRGNGYGRTTIRRESNGLVQLRSQGTHGGEPFSIEAEARHTGRC